MMMYERNGGILQNTKSTPEPLTQKKTLVVGVSFVQKR